MANPIVADLGPIVGTDTDAIVVSNTPAGAGNLALVGAGTVTLDVPRQVLVTYGNELVARTIKIYGTNGLGGDGIGPAITETLTIPSGGSGTIGTTQNFKTVTRVEVFIAWTAAMEVGTSAIAFTQWFVTDIIRNPILWSFVFTVVGTVNYTLEWTQDDPNVSVTPSIEPASYQPPKAFADATAAAKTGNFQFNSSIWYFAWRLKLNSGSGSVRTQAIQSGYRGA